MSRIGDSDHRSHGDRGGHGACAASRARTGSCARGLTFLAGATLLLDGRRVLETRGAAAQ
jgi:hypothetical protein